MDADQRKTRPPFGGLEGVGYGGVSPREDVVKIALMGKGGVNAKKAFTMTEKISSLLTFLALRAMTERTVERHL